jgi:hypothetical protein
MVWAAFRHFEAVKTGVKTGDRSCAGLLKWDDVPDSNSKLHPMARAFARS